MRRLTVLMVLISLVAISCGDDDAPATTAADPSAEGAATAPGLRLLAIDFTLGSAAIINTADKAISSGGHWLCSGDDCVELDPQPIGPRDSILFREDVVGRLDPADGELALFASDAFNDPNVLRSYVQWGSTGHFFAPLAETAAIWPRGEFIESSAETTLLTNIDPTATDVANWEASAD